MLNEYVTNIEVTAPSRYPTRRLPHDAEANNTTSFFGTSVSGLVSRVHG